MRQIKNNKTNNMQNVYIVAKRIALTIVICIPFLFAFAFLTRNIITSNAIQILCFISIMIVAVIIEELVVRLIKKHKSKQVQVEDKKDVFK